MSRAGTSTPHPFVVILVAAVLPGVGHLMCGLPKRGLVFVFYTVLLGAVTYQVADPARSLLGQVAGGAFVYAISVLDAYRIAATRRHLDAGVSGPVRSR